MLWRGITFCVSMILQLIKFPSLDHSYYWQRGGGGGGGGLGASVFRGYIRSLSKFKNTPKALISAPKSTLNLNKRLLFPVKKHPFLYQNTDIVWTATRILTFDVIILCLFSGRSSGIRLGSPVTSGVTLRQSRVYFVDCKGIFTPTYYVCDPFSREIRNAGAPPPPAL